MSSIPVVQPRRPVRDGLRAFVLALSLKRVGVALLLAVLAAFVLSLRSNSGASADLNKTDKLNCKCAI